MGYARADRRYNERKLRLFPIKISRENKKAPDMTVGICRRCADVSQELTLCAGYRQVPEG
jgi:hypothetical protein